MTLVHISVFLMSVRGLRRFGCSVSGFTVVFEILLFGAVYLRDVPFRHSEHVFVQGCFLASRTSSLT
jgi:hypothetical protein